MASEVSISDVAKSPSDIKVTVLVVGPDPLTADLLANFKSVLEITEIAQKVEILLEEIQPAPNVIICTVPPQVADASEIAQLLNSQYDGVPLYLVANRNAKLNRKILLKNGFTDIFFFPVDRGIFVGAMEEVIAKTRSRGKVFKPIKIVDVTPGTQLSFDTFLYLSANNKHIKYSAAGDTLPRDRAEKLKQHDIGALYISGKDSRKFYDYTALKLKELHGDTQLSETEKSERMTAAVRDLFGSMFSESADSIDSGKSLVSDGQKIIKSFILQTTNKATYDRILSIAANNSDFYSHSSNVASYACLFAMGLSLPNVSDIAMAALLHDLGLSKVPDDIISKDLEKLNPAEKILYEKHVDYTIEVIREKKLILSDLTRKIIYQHHEKYNGTGYPKGVTGDRICIEAQILGLADRFDYLTSLRKGKPRVSPKDAINKIVAECAVSSKTEFDLKLVKKIQALF